MTATATTPAWLTISEAKVLWVPTGEVRVNKNGEEKPVVIRTGIRIEFADGTKWFYHFKFQTWTRTEQGAFKLDHFGNSTKERGEDVKTRFGKDPKLQRELAHCPKLIEALFAGRDQAILDEAEKRAA